MPSEAVLDHAVREGIISDDQRARILAIARQDAGGHAQYASPDEPFRLFRGFRDFFLAIGLLIFAFGIGGSAIEFLGLDWTVLMGGDSPFAGAATFAVVAAIGWLFGELVTRRLRMPLSSIVVVMAFCGAVAIAAAFLAGGLFKGMEHDKLVFAIGCLSALAGVAAAIAYYLRFRLPFVLLPLAGSAVTAVYMAVAFAAPTYAISHLPLLLGLLGVSVFIAAMRYDLSDPNRLTRYSECAFWLHLLAAPLVVHSVVSPFREALYSGRAEAAIYVLEIIAVLAVIALIIDRRALLVSGLVYLGSAIAVSLQTLSGPGLSFVPYTFFTLGAVLVGLGIGWTPVRRLILKLIPNGELLRRLPPAYYES